MYNEDVYPNVFDEIPPLYLIDIPEQELLKLFSDLYDEQQAQEKKKGNQ